MTKHFLKVGGTAMTLALLTIGATAVQSRTMTETALKQAEGAAAAAAKALARRDAVAAVRLAEEAVALRPQDATYRALLGKAYLSAGRFESARQALADAMALDGGLPGIALNYALATTATGDFAAAQQILATHAAAMAPADRGLALALAGDPAGGVELLMAAARLPTVDAKTRQNLALALALAGRWPDARQMALADLSPSDADARIVQWAAFARPAAASDQVAALLGVTAVVDTGVPAQLALVGVPGVTVAAAPVPVVTAPVVAAQDWQPDVVMTDAAVPVAVAAAVVPATVPATLPAPQVGSVIFGDRREVAQALPTVLALPAGPAVAHYARTSVPDRAVAATGKGGFYVQLGAFHDTTGARSAWGRAKARHAALAGKTPWTMATGTGLIRVSVGGFGRADANRLCRTVKTDGGVCFVRAAAGDRVAAWNAAGDIRLAAR